MDVSLKGFAIKEERTARLGESNPSPDVVAVCITNQESKKSVRVGRPRFKSGIKSVTNKSRTGRP